VFEDMFLLSAHGSVQSHGGLEVHVRDLHDIDAILHAFIYCYFSFIIFVVLEYCYYYYFRVRLKLIRAKRSVIQLTYFFEDYFRQAISERVYYYKSTADNYVASRPETS